MKHCVDYEELAKFKHQTFPFKRSEYFTEQYEMGKSLG